MFTGTKSPINSTTIRGAVVLAIIWLLSQLGVLDMTEADVEPIVSKVIQVSTTVLEIVAWLSVVWGRIKANRTISI
jgi:hypothetical protein